MGKELVEVTAECDLRVIVQGDLKVSKQCTKAVNTANRILGLINRTLEFKSKDTVLQLYKSLVRPHLEYCIQCWNPYYRKDIELIEKVQRRATRMIDSLKKYSYHERLQRLQLTTLESRRVRGDLIEVYKIMNGFEDIDYRDYFNISSTGLRGHEMKLYKSRFNTTIRGNSFSRRIIDNWNNLM